LKNDKTDRIIQIEIHLHTLSKIISNGHEVADSVPCPGVIELQDEAGAPVGFAATSFRDKQSIKAANNDPYWCILKDNFDDICIKDLYGKNQWP
jgi:hypothetical protein